MRINFGINVPPIENYLNLDLVQDREGVQKSDIGLSQIPNGSCEVINTVNAINYISSNDIQKLLSLWKDRLMVGGVLFIASPDLPMISTRLSYDQITVEEFNREVFGLNTGARFNGIFGLDFITRVFESLNMKIVGKGYSGNNFYIEAQKVE